ncbi:HAD family hydrolase [Lentzea chajnantorensis]
MTNIAHVLGTAEAIFFDFDGPVCSVFAGYPASAVAAEMLKALSVELGGLPATIAGEADPMEVLRWTGQNWPNLVSCIDDVLCAAEYAAVDGAGPTPFAHEAIEAARRRGQSTAIVSNNSAPAIEKYLNFHSLKPFVDFIAGRPYAEPTRMKPNPDSLIRAVNALGIKPDAALLIGDAVTDIEASLVAGVVPVGYAKTAARRVELENAGATVVIDSMDGLLVGR